MAHVFEPAPRAALKVAGSSDEFPVRRVYCVGRNYAAHAREMGMSDKEPPFFFTKSSDADCVIPVSDGQSVKIQYPTRTENLHYEVELVVAIAKDGKNISAESAKDYIYGYAIGLDMTRRDLQAQLKDKGQPWEVAKAFDQAAPIGELHTDVSPEDAKAASIRLNVNGKQAQHGHLKDLIWSIPEVIAELSSYFELKAGDIIFTGTPEGVGPVKKGDVMEAEFVGKSSIKVELA